MYSARGIALAVDKPENVEEVSPAALYIKEYLETTEEVKEECMQIARSVDEDIFYDIEEAPPSYNDIPVEYLFCHICHKHLHDAPSFMHHINSEEHRELLEGRSHLLDFSTPVCRICEMKFSSALDLGKHQLTASHLLAKEKAAKVDGANVFSRPCPCCCIISME